MLQKPDLSGRLVAWSVELSEYDKCVCRGTGFGRFCGSPESGEKVNTHWTLFVNGSSSGKGSRAGVTFEGLGDLTLEKSLRFEFQAINNQAEYDALITGLKLAIEVRIESLHIRTNSKLVANQVHGVYQVKKPQLAKYLEHVCYLMSRLQEVTVEYVPRVQNQRADVLAKLASTQKPGNNRSVIQETLMYPSIEGELVGCVNRGDTWMGPILDILAGTHEEVVHHTKEQRWEASHYTLLDGALFR